MRINSRHMEAYWPEEMSVIRECIHEDNVLGTHILEQMNDRDISVHDVAVVLMTGHIIEGFDVGKYPNYRNPDMIRNVVGKDTIGRWINIGVAISIDNRTHAVKVDKLTTVYELTEAQYQMRSA